MAYIGVQPTDTYLSIASQQITGNGGATYTLNYSVSDEESLAVFVNNVRQNVSSYTVSGDQLTLGGTISASDECWILFLGRTVGTKAPAVGSVTNDMLAGSIANAKLANSSITLNGSAVSLGGSASVANTPAFNATIGSEMSLSQNTWTTITADTEIIDTDSCYNTSTYTFTPTTAGKYFVFANIRMADNSAGTYAYVSFYKNGATNELQLEHYIASHGSSQNNTELTLNCYKIIDFNGSTDNVLCRVQVSSTGVEVKAGNSASNWGAYKLIGA
jgi:hypothetical protein